MFIIRCMISKWKNRSLRYLRDLVLGAILLLQGSCIGDFNGQLPSEYEWSPLLAFPIGWAEFGLDVGEGFDTLLTQIDSLGFPYWASLPAIPFSGNILFDFEEVLGEREEVQTVQLRVNAYNGFPVEIKAQAYLLDSRGVVLDSLFDPVLSLERGELSGGGETVAYAVTQQDILFEGSRLDLLVATREIAFKGEIGNVAYFPEFTFEVQLGAILGVVTSIPLSGE